MSGQARLTSLEALEAFRSNLIVYLSQVRPVLEEVTAGVVRTRLWLEEEQRRHWDHEVRRRGKELQEAQQALFSSRLGSLRHETSAEYLLVQRAKRQLDEAETKLRILKKWDRDYDGKTQPLVKQMEKLQTILSNDMVKAVASLTQTINTLAAYAEVRRETTPEAP